MICPGCDRDNDPRRRYCGKCGRNFDPVCRACSFANERVDRFCGGCGAILIARDGCHVRRAAGPAPRIECAPVPAIQYERNDVVQAPAASPAPAFRPAPAGELDGLFATPAIVVEPPRLPDAGIGQADLDRLFGGSA